MQQFLVTFVAEHGRLAFVTPRAGLKHAFGLGAFAIG